MHTKHIKLIIAVIAIGFIALIGWAIYRAIVIKGTVTIYTAPITTTIEINGKRYADVETGKKYDVTSRTLSVTASREGFTSETLTYNLTDGENAIYLTPQAKSDEAKKLMQTDEEAANLQFVATEKSLVISEQQHRENPFLDKLPYYGRYFTLSQGISEKNADTLGAFALYVDYDDSRGKEEALDFIRESGSDPSKFEIIFREQVYKTRDQE